VHPPSDRLRNSKHAVDTLARPLLEEADDARLLQKQTADEVVAHTPERGQLVDRAMAFERCFLSLPDGLRLAAGF
jgi:hypothetical protein